MKLHLGYLLGIAAIFLAICAAFFSIYGLSQLFAGAAISVIIMASTLEMSKLIIASYLHSYWDSISKVMRVYLTLGVIILAIITSAGIYGYLSNAYQITANQLELHDGKIGAVESKIDNFQRTLDANSKLIDSKTKRMDQLVEIRTKQESRIDTETTNSKSNMSMIKSTSSSIDALNKEIDDLNGINTKINDSIGALTTKKIEINSSNSVTGEVGPLKFMAKITGLEMDKIVNIFILLLVFVFDPLAICLVIATNSVFEKNKHENKTANDKPQEEKIEEVPQIVENEEKNEAIEDHPQLEFEKKNHDEVFEEKVVNNEVINTKNEQQSDGKVGGKLRFEDIREIKALQMKGGESSRNFSKKIPVNNNHIGRIR